MNKKTYLPLMTGLMLCFIAGCKDSAPTEKPVVVTKRIDQTAATTPAPEAAPKPAAQDAKAAAEAPAPAVDAGAEKAPPVPAAVEPVAQAPAPAVETPTVPAPKAPDGAESDTAKAEGPAAQTEQTVAAAPPDEQPAAVEAEAVSLKNAFLEDDVAPRYDPTGKIDPFAALYSAKQDDAASGESTPKRPLTPLEKIDLSQLKLVAVLLAESGDRAMVEDATGKPYILSPGTYIGINSGTVTNILKDRVVIEEKSKDILGKETSSTRELKLQKPLGEE